MHSAETDAKVLLFKNDWNVFEDSIGQLPQVIFALGNAFKLDIGVDLAQARRRLELFRAALIDKVTEHQLDFEAVLSICEGSIGLKVKLNAEVPHVVELYFLFLVSNHETTRIKAELVLVEPRWEDVVMILLLPLLRLLF